MGFRKKLGDIQSVELVEGSGSWWPGLGPWKGVHFRIKYKKDQAESQQVVISTLAQFKVKFELK